MAADKLVDSSKLDASLTATADAIRAKTGGSAAIAYDLENETGFAAAVAAIPSGGGRCPRSEQEMLYEDVGHRQEWLSEIEAPTMPFSGEYYLENDGAAYINTGYIVQTTTKVVLRCLVRSYPSTAYPALFGVRKNTNANRFFFWMRKNSAMTAVRGWGNNEADAFSSAKFFDHGITVTLQPGMAKVESSITGSSTHTWSPAGAPSTEYPLFIFQLDQNGAVYGASTACYMRLFECSIYEGDTLVHHYTPDQDGDGVACLYDTVTETYLYNAGSGAFTYGRQ